MSDQTQPPQNRPWGNSGWGEMTAPARIYDGDLDDVALFKYAKICLKLHPYLTSFLDEERQGNEGIVQRLKIFVDQIYDAIIQTDNVRDKKTQSGKDAEAVRWVREGHWTHDQIRRAAWRLLIECMDVHFDEEVGVEVLNIRTKKHEMTILKDDDYPNWIARLKDSYENFWYHKSYCKNVLDSYYANPVRKGFANPQKVSKTKEENGKSNEIRQKRIKSLQKKDDTSEAGDTDDIEEPEQPPRKIVKVRKRQTAPRSQPVTDIENNFGSHSEGRHGFSEQDISSPQELFRYSGEAHPSNPTSLYRPNIPTPVSGIMQFSHPNDGPRLQPNELSNITEHPVSIRSITGDAIQASRGRMNTGQFSASNNRPLNRMALQTLEEQYLFSNGYNVGLIDSPPPAEMHSDHRLNSYYHGQDINMGNRFSELAGHTHSPRNTPGYTHAAEMQASNPIGLNNSDSQVQQATFRPARAYGGVDNGLRGQVNRGSSTLTTEVGRTTRATPLLPQADTHIVSQLHPYRQISRSLNASAHTESSKSPSLSQPNITGDTAANAAAEFDGMPDLVAVPLSSMEQSRSVVSFGSDHSGSGGTVRNSRSPMQSGRPAAKVTRRQVQRRFGENGGGSRAHPSMR